MLDRYAEKKRLKLPKRTCCWRSSSMNSTHLTSPACLCPSLFLTGVYLCAPHIQILNKMSDSSSGLLLLLHVTEKEIQGSPYWVHLLCKSFQLQPLASLSMSLFISFGYSIVVIFQ